jgi:hypothetical protein
MKDNKHLTFILRSYTLIQTGCLCAWSWILQFAENISRENKQVQIQIH